VFFNVAVYGQSSYQAQGNESEVKSKGELAIPTQYIKIGIGVLVGLILLKFLLMSVQNSRAKKYARDVNRRSLDEIKRKRGY